MSHNTPITPDPAYDQPIVLRKARNGDIIFRFKDTEGNPFPIEDEFYLNIKINDKATGNLLQLSTDEEEELEIDENEIIAHFTEDNSNIDRSSCFWELFNRTTGKSWFASKVSIITGANNSGAESSVEVTINLGDQVIEVTLEVARTMTADEIVSSISGDSQALTDLFEALKPLLLNP